MLARSRNMNVGLPHREDVRRLEMESGEDGRDFPFATRSKLDLSERGTQTDFLYENKGVRDDDEQEVGFSPDREDPQTPNELG
jgi:hypothetical protein